MFGKKIRLFKVFGFEVGIDPSWTILAILIAWSLSAGLFPAQIAGLSIKMYWIMGVVGMLGLFASIILHEIAHSIVARKQGMTIQGITLFVFGGVSEMADDSPGPWAEFTMAVAGPITSIMLSAVFYLVAIFMKLPGPIVGIFWYLSMINAILAFFNLLPAFPLDGGRIVRSALWGWKKDLHWATRIASRIGVGFGFLIIFLGVLQFFTGNFLGGLWWFLIGMFLRNSAQSAYEQLILRETLQGEPVERFMTTDPVTVKPSISVDDLIKDYVYKYHYKMFPIVEESGQLVGCVTTRQVDKVPRQEWDKKHVADISLPCSAENVVSPKTDAMQALSLMERTGTSRLLVATGNRLVGILALKDMVKFLSMRLEPNET
ncbi:MAG: site-2 protease family protein [Syntrophorhabdus sp.]